MKSSSATVFGRQARWHVVLVPNRTTRSAIALPTAQAGACLPGMSRCGRTRCHKIMTPKLPPYVQRMLCLTPFLELQVVKLNYKRGSKGCYPRRHISQRCSACSPPIKSWSATCDDKILYVVSHLRQQGASISEPQRFDMTLASCWLQEDALVRTMSPLVTCRTKISGAFSLTDHTAGGCFCASSVSKPRLKTSIYPPFHNVFDDCCFSLAVAPLLSATLKIISSVPYCSTYTKMTAQFNQVLVVFFYSSRICRVQDVAGSGA